MSEANAVGLAKFHNAEIDYFGHKLFVYDLISGSLVNNQYRIHFDANTFGERRYADSGTRRVGFIEVLRHDFIDDWKVAEINEEDVQLDHVGQATARGAGYCLQVVKYTRDFCLDTTLNHFHARRIERNLARNIYRIIYLHGLRIGTDRLGRVGGVNDGFCHVHSPA